MNDDYTFWVHKDDREPVSDLAPALTGAEQFPWGKIIHFGSVRVNAKA